MISLNYQNKQPEKNNQMNIGKLTNEKIEDYHSNSALGSSMLRVFMDDPDFYRSLYIDKDFARKETAALEFGKKIHSFILEDTTILANDHDLRTKAGKIESEKIIKENPNAIVSRSPEIKQFHLMKNSLDKTLSRSGYFTDVEDMRQKCEIECTFRLKLKGGLYLQCRPDALSEDTIWDLKTTASISTFNRSLWSYGYHIQAGFYYGILSLLGEPERDFKFLAIDKSEPYKSCVFSFTAEQCSTFWLNVVQPAIQNLGDCIEKNEWPGKFHEEVKLEIPEGKI